MAPITEHTTPTIGGPTVPAASRTNAPINAPPAMEQLKTNT
jgi:hypothetical protein